MSLRSKELYVEGLLAIASIVSGRGGVGYASTATSDNTRLLLFEGGGRKPVPERTRGAARSRECIVSKRDGP